MAATPISTRPTNKQYLGNSNTTEVHDLHNEKTQCQIDVIVRTRHAVVFTPDSLSQAHADGYENCSYCIGGSTR